MRRLAAAALLLLAASFAAPLSAGERMTSETNDMARGVAGGAGGLDGSATSGNRLDAAFGEEVGGSSSSAAANRLAPGFVQLFSFPGAVTDLAARSDVSVSSVTLQWTAPGLDGARGSLAAGSSYYLRVASYTVPDTFAPFSAANIVFSTAGTFPGALVSTSAAGLQPNTTYWARIWTKDPAGGLSYASEISTFVTLALPVGLQEEAFVAVHFTSVAAQWVPRPSLLQDVSSMSAAGYRLEASSTSFGTLSPGGVISSSETANLTLSTLTVSDPGLVVDRTYYFRAGSLNWAGQPNWTVLGATDTKFQVNDPLPGAPPYVGLSTGSMTAYWERNGNPSDTRYHAEASDTVGFTGAVTSTDTYNLFYSTGGLEANTTYYFRVYATTRSVSSAFASLASTMTWAFAPAPATEPFALVHASSLTARWLYNGAAAGVSTYSVVATTSPAYPNADAGAVLLLSTRPAGADPMATLTGLVPNTTYFLFGSGVNWVGAQGGFVLLGSTATRPAPAASAGFEEISFSSIVVSWGTAGNPLAVTTYTVTLSTVAAYPPGGAWDVSVSTVPDASLVILPLDGLQLNATYHLFVAAVGHAHAALAVGPSSATQASPPGASADAGDYDPVAETAFSVNWSSGAVDPGYDAIPPWTTYYADIAENPSFSPVLASSVTYNLSAAFTGLSVNATYYARVAAYSHHHGALTAYADFGSSATMAAVPAAGAPTFARVNFTSATVAWGRNGNPVDVTTYTVAFTSGSVYPNDLPDNVVLDTAPAGAALSATIAGLDSNTTYTMFVRAINHKGAETAWANLGSTRTLFSPKTWVGGSGANWNTAANWSPSGIPTRTDAVTIGIAANISAIGAQISFSSLTLGGPLNPVVALTLSTTIASGGSVLIYKNAGLTQATTRQLVIDGDFTMVSGSSLSHTAFTGTSVSSVNISVTGTFDLQAGSTIAVSSCGYAGGASNGGTGSGPGPGLGSSASSGGGSGGGHGNSGGASAAGAGGGAYGSSTNPVDAGSGGGGGDFASGTNTGGAGGGVVRLIAGTMLLNGRIEALGASGGPGSGTAARGAGGGGSGGAVNLTAGVFSGAGAILVQGGSGGADANAGLEPGGGGAGGRIAIAVTGSGVTCAVAASVGGGASGGGTAGAGSAGTFYASDSLVAAQDFAGAPLSATSLAWTWSLSNGATEYQVYSSTGGPMSPPLGAVGNYTTAGLAVNTTASFFVAARACGSSVDSSAGEVSTLATAPAATSGSAFADVSLSSMSVSWEENGNPVDVTTYTVVLTPEAAYPNANAGNVSLTTFPAGASLSASLAGLYPNTTFFLFVAAKNHAGLLTAYADLSTAAATRALPPVALAFADTFPSIQFTTVSVAWGALALVPPDASSMTSEGYLLEISSTNFGVLLPGGVTNSSTTTSVLASTLTVSYPDVSVSTNYYRVSSLNWAGLKNTLQLGKMNFQILQSTGLVGLGTLSAIERSTVSVSSMVVTNLGDLPATFILSAATATTPSSPWTLSTSSGIETVTLQGVWNAGGPPAPPASLFSTFMTTTPRLSGGGGNYAGNETGVAVPPGSSRTLWFYFWAPTSTVSTSPETIQVKVDAVKP